MKNPDFGMPTSLPIPNKDGPPALNAADNAWSSHRAREPAFELFRSPDGDAFVDVQVDGHRETHPVTSQQFRHWFALHLFDLTDEAPTATELKRRIELLQAKAAQQEMPVREVYVRIAFAEHRIYIDLADSNWSVIEIATDGWRVVQSPRVRFVRTPDMLALPMPQSGGSIETLQNLLNVRDDDHFVLVIAWLLNALRGNGQHPILAQSGGEGTAKTTRTLILQALIDPNCIPLGGLPRSQRELRTRSRHRYLQVFDNISDLSVPMSNALCRLATGFGSRPIILNGIEDVVRRPDLTDRCVFIDCDPIADEQRRPEAELWAEFEKIHAQVFGVLLDALVASG